MCGYFCIGFIDLMLKGKSLLDYTNSFSPNDYENNDKITLNCFKKNLDKLKCIAMFAIYIENVKKLEYCIFLKKRQVFLLFIVNVVMNMKKYLKKKNQLKY